MSKSNFLVAGVGVVSLAALLFLSSAKPEMPEAHDYAAEFECAAADYPCASEFFRAIVRSAGSALALEVLGELMASRKIAASVDEHQLAHEVGRQTAESFGVSSASFLSCPMSAFNGGCQHGFFEYVLLRTPTAAEAADSICRGLGGEYSEKFRFYCYHGVGHGVLMAVAYDLDKGLEVCNTIEPAWAAEGCWQGLFMENVNAGMRGEARDGVFSVLDPLQPCESLAAKYHHQCYDNHAGYLMVFFRNDFSKAVAACLGAKEAGDRSTCLQSIGNMATNPSWQINFLGDATGENTAERGWKLCLKFPEDYRKDCVIGGTNNIMNFNELKPLIAEEFCRMMDAANREHCYRAIGTSLRHQSTTENEIRPLCAGLDSAGRNLCELGAGMVVDK